MSAQHTPGPWRSANSDDWNVSCDLHGTSSYVAIGQANGKPVCFAVAHSPSLFDTASSDAELDANARLIAAAPELLEACQTFAEWLRREEAGFPAETRFTTADGEAKWREWFDENGPSNRPAACGRSG